jgi:hypothetical protein
MIKCLLILPLLLSSLAFAQFSVQDQDGVSRFRLLGKSWTPSFYSLTSLETDKTQEGGRLSTYNYLSLKTFLRGDYRFALRIPFQYNSAGTDRFDGDKVMESEVFLQDIILEVQNYNLLMLPLDVGLYWAGRVYLPTGKYSQRSGQIARLRNDFIFDKVFNRYFEAEYTNKFNYYIQSRSAYQNSFVDEDGYDVEAASLTKKAELEHYVTVWGKFNADTGLGWELGATDTYWNRSGALNRSKPGLHQYQMGPNLRFALSEYMNFILQYHDVVDQEANRGEFGRFLAKNTEWILHSFIRF